MEALEKNAFDIEIVHKKTKNYYSTAKQNKGLYRIKIVDSTPRLDLIKRQSLTKNVSNIMKVKL